MGWHKSIHNSIVSSGASFILIWFPKSELDEWSDEDGSDYQDDTEGQASENTEISDMEEGNAKEEEEVQDGNAKEDEAELGGGGGPMPKMPTKMPSPEKMNDKENWCGTFLHSVKKNLFLPFFSVVGSQAQPSKFDQWWQLWN